MALHCDCAVHACALMANRVHLLLTPQAEDSLARLMQHPGRHYVPYINRRHCRSGTLWEGRYKTSLVQQEVCLFRCYHCIEPNPVRTGMVAEPGGYRWSSHASNVDARRNLVITPPFVSPAGAKQKGALSALPVNVSCTACNSATGLHKDGLPVGYSTDTDRIRRSIGADWYVAQYTCDVAGREEKGSDPFSCFPMFYHCQTSIVGAATT